MNNIRFITHKCSVSHFKKSLKMHKYIYPCMRIYRYQAYETTRTKQKGFSTTQIAAFATTKSHSTTLQCGFEFDSLFGLSYRLVYETN